MRLAKTASVMMASLLFASCGQEQNEVKPELATVNGKPVYQDHIDVMLDKFPPDAVAKAGGDIEKKVLESLVRAKAIAEMARNELSSRELEKIKLRAELYQEELLAAAYIEENATIEPVSDAMVKSYYEKNRERYSLGNQVHIQYLQSEYGLEESQKKALMQKMSEIPGEADWEDYKNKLAKEGFPILYRDSNIKASLLKKPLDSIVASLEPGAASSVFYGEPVYRVRLVEEENLGYQPISAVSGEIRRKLAPLQMKKAVKLVSDKALESVRVEYPNN